MKYAKVKVTVNKCCLFINDDPADQRVFAEALGDVFPEVLCFTAPTAVDALYMMTEENLVPDYILMELNLPKMNGIEFLNKVKQHNVLREVPVIIHSVIASPEQIQELKESGALAIYYKPYDYFGVCTMLTLYFGSNILRIAQN